MAPNPEDERGFLTQTDIEFLKGEKEYSQSSSRSNRRKRIRERFIAALHDCHILLEHWPMEQQQKTVDEIEDQSEESIQKLGSDAVAVLYSLANSTNADPAIIESENPIQQLERFRIFLNRGIRKGKQEFDESPGTISTAATTRLYDLPSTEETRKEGLTEKISEITRHVNKKHQEAVGFEDTGNVLGGDDMNETHEMALNALYREWHTRVSLNVRNRRRFASSFVFNDPYVSFSTMDLPGEFDDK